MVKNIIPHQHQVTREDRIKLRNNRPAALWFTGLSGSGKSTIANEVEWRLAKEFGCHTYLLDGDNLREGLNSNLGFGDDDRKENIRRFGEVARLFVDAGMVVLAALISPFHEERAAVRNRFNESEFFEVFVECPLETCEKRDPKGLYAKARKGEIPLFTGISSPYETPENPDLVVHNGDLTPEESVEKVIEFLLEKGVFHRRE